MNLKNYLVDLMLNEKNIIEELIKVDNKVMLSRLTFDELFSIVKKCKIDIQPNWNFSYNFILDGDINTIIYILMNYSTCINKIHVNRNYVGISSWLIERINQYYNNDNTYINLDISKSYIYISQTDLLVICGNKLFIDGMKDIFSNKELIIIEMSDKCA